MSGQPGLPSNLLSIPALQSHTRFTGKQGSMPTAFSNFLTQVGNNTGTSARNKMTSSVRFGLPSKADLAASNPHVRCAPESGHSTVRPARRAG